MTNTQSSTSGAQTPAINACRRSIRLLAPGCSLMVFLLAGCSHHPTVLGSTPVGSAQPVAAVSKAPSRALVTVRGTMIEKCPVAGCWFDIRDNSGRLRVDTKSAGFVVLEVPLQTIVTVHGRIVHRQGDTLLEASGVSF